MTLSVNYAWKCDGCDRAVSLSEEKTPPGWRSIYGKDVFHVCSRECARSILQAQVEDTLNGWFPKLDEVPTSGVVLDIAFDTDEVPTDG